MTHRVKNLQRRSTMIGSACALSERAASAPRSNVIIFELRDYYPKVCENREFLSTNILGASAQSFGPRKEAPLYTGNSV